MEVSALMVILHPGHFPAGSSLPVSLKKNQSWFSANCPGWGWLREYQRGAGSAIRPDLPGDPGGDPGGGWSCPAPHSNPVLTQ